MISSVQSQRAAAATTRAVTSLCRRRQPLIIASHVPRHHLGPALPLRGGSATTATTATTATATTRSFRTTSICALSDPEGPKTKQLKVKKKEKKGSKKSKETGGRDKLLDMQIRALDTPKTKPPPASEEEMQRRHDVGRNYGIGKFRRHNSINHDLNCKLRMKEHAVNMLPRGTMWREEALKIDGEGPPMWRHIPLDTPPIPGFDPSQFLTDED